MLKNEAGDVVFSPTDLIRFMSSPFASWMDRYHLECPGELKPDASTQDQRLIQTAGLAHEDAVLEEFRANGWARGLRAVTSRPGRCRRRS